MKTCPKCGRTKSAKLFYKRSGSLYLRSWCKACEIQKILQWQKTSMGRIATQLAAKRYAKKHPVLQRQRELRKQNSERYRGYDLKKHYGITTSEWKDLFKKQKHRCAICGCKKPNTKNLWFTDHNHQTKKIRGILCGKCNSVLGYGQDSIRILKAAIQYLRRNEE